MTKEPRLTDQLGEGHNPAALSIERFHTTDSECVRRFFANAYKAGWQLDGFASGSSLTVRRQAADGITIDEFLVKGRIRVKVRPADSVTVIQPRAGSLALADETISGPDAFLLCADGVPCTLETKPAQFHVVSIDAKLLHRVAAEEHPSLPEQIDFSGPHPRSRTIAGAWHRALDHVIAGFNSADAAQRPLMVRAATRMLTAATLECFPSNVNAGQDLLETLTVPQSFRDAVVFIQNHAGRGIGINDVAAALHLTPRAVQYLFRQQAGMTPTEYLRRVRLHNARADLMRGDPSTTTVSAVAQKWGFAHTGRFSAQYRQAYGESPRITLRT